MAQIHVTEKHTKTRPAGGQPPPHQAGTHPYAGYSNQITTVARYYSGKTPQALQALR